MLNHSHHHVILYIILEQMMVYLTGLIPSRFYEVLGDRDDARFKALLISTSFIITGTALVSNW